MISVLRVAARRRACATVALAPEPDPLADIRNGATAAYATSIWDSVVAVAVRFQDGTLLAARLLSGVGVESCCGHSESRELVTSV